MNKTSIPFLVFACLCLLSCPLFYDFGFSVIPGWHTILIPPQAVKVLLVFIILIIVSCCYWILYRKNNDLPLWVFIVQVTCTLPLILWLLVPSALLLFLYQDVYTSRTPVFFTITVADALFISGQILFSVYFVKTLLKPLFNEE